MLYKCTYCKGFGTGLGNFVLNFYFTAIEIHVITACQRSVLLPQIEVNFLWTYYWGEIKKPGEKLPLWQWTQMIFTIWYWGLNPRPQCWEVEVSPADPARHLQNVWILSPAFYQHTAVVHCFDTVRPKINVNHDTDMSLARPWSE